MLASIDKQVMKRQYACRKSMSLTKPKLLIVTHNLSRTGAPYITLSLARIMRESYDITVISPVPGDLEILYAASGIHLLINSSIIDCSEETRTVLKEFDLIILSTSSLWSIALQAKRWGMKVIWMIHDALSTKLSGNAGWRKTIIECNFVVFPSEDTRQRYKDHLQTDNHQVVPYGIDYPIPLQNNLCKTKTKRNVQFLHVGVKTPRKGQDILVRSIEVLHNNDIEGFEFVFIGAEKASKQSYAEVLRSRTAHIPTVKWLGELDHEETLAYIASCDVLVCTSRDDPSPLVVIEALLCGKAVVSTPVGIMNDIIIDNYNGILVPYGDYQLLTEKLMLLGLNHNLRERLGRTGGRTAQLFNQHRYRAEIEFLIDLLLNGAV